MVRNFRALIAALCLCWALPVAAQQVDALPRHGFLGVAAALRNGAVTVAAVVPGSSAARAGIATGDRIAAVGGTNVTSVAQFLQLVHAPAGTSLQLALVRNGAPLTLGVTLAPAPTETDPAVDTLYRSVSIDGTLRRVLLTVPHGAKGPFPAMMIVGGIGCFTIDTSNPQDAYRNLARDVSAHGFATLRLEKSGIGDSQGAPCSTVDFTTEMHGYAVALRWLAANSLVDASHVFLFGHSIGSTIVPRLALEQPVRGVIVAEGVGINWFEYELINERRQLLLDPSVKPAEIDPAMQLKERCTHALEIEREDYATIRKAEPDCASILDVYPVPAAYMQQVAALNIAEPWTKLDVAVLAIYGTSDFVTDESDHRSIVALVNQNHPGTATFVAIEGMDHLLASAPSARASFDNFNRGVPEAYDRALSATVVAWLCRQAKCAPPKPAAP